VTERQSSSTRAPLRMTDGTTQLLRGGASIVGTGLVALVLVLTVFGGVTRTGAHSNGGWLALIVALMCIPFGGLLLLLGLAKWFRNRSMARRQ
jgi:uncharacterized membrane protein YidH (DUF202 family)